mgnify:CR=1 FL=1
MLPIKRFNINNILNLTAHATFVDFKERITTEQWKEILLHDADQVIYKGCIMKLIAKKLGYGVVEISKEKNKDLNKKSKEKH